MSVDILQTTLPADPLKFPSKLFHFERFQSLDFLSFLKELFFFPSFSARSSFLARGIFTTDGGGQVTRVTTDFCVIPVVG
jgi:hypothetical protein